MLVFAMVAHEYAHAVTALRQGDDTAYTLGRVTLNPLPHIDPWMSLLLEKVPLVILAAGCAVQTLLVQRQGGAMNFPLPLWADRVYRALGIRAIMLAPRNDDSRAVLSKSSPGRGR